jgi:hypothetical protein
MEFFIGVILAGIIAFEVFRMLGKKVPKPKKSVEGEAKGIDKVSIVLIAIALAVVVFLAILFIGLLITYN